MTMRTCYVKCFNFNKTCSAAHRLKIIPRPPFRFFCQDFITWYLWNNYFVCPFPFGVVLRNEEMWFNITNERDVQRLFTGILFIIIVHFVGIDRSYIRIHNWGIIDFLLVRYTCSINLYLYRCFVTLWCTFSVDR